MFLGSGLAAVIEVDAIDVAAHTHRLDQDVLGVYIGMERTERVNRFEALDPITQHMQGSVRSEVSATMAPDPPAQWFTFT